MGPRLVVISRSIEEGIRGSRIVINTSGIKEDTRGLRLVQNVYVHAWYNYS